MENKCRLWPNILSVMVASLGYIAMGYALGYPSSTLLELALLPEEHRFEESGLESQLFVVLMPIAAVFGSPLGGLMADRGGRKWALLASGVPNLIGWLLIALSKYTMAAFKPVILTGRFLTGFASGWLSTVVTLYVAEISETRWRGLFGVYTEITVIFGTFLSYAMGAIPDVTYNYSAFVAVAIVVIFAILMTTVYESPRYLLCRGYDAKAMTALCWLRKSPEVAQKEFEEIKRLVTFSPKLSLTAKLREFKKKHVYSPLILGLVFIFFQQFSGVNAIIFYAATIFQTAGVSQPRETAIYAVGAVQVIATTISSAIVDLVGRKVLLVIGSIGITLASGTLGTHFFITRPELCNQQTTNWSMEFLNVTTLNSTGPTLSDAVTCNPQFSPLAVGSLVLFGFAYSISWRGIPYTVVYEISPLSLRGLLGGIILCETWIFVGIVTGFYLDFESAVRPYTAWWVFAFVSLIGVFFVLFFLLETKGKTLEEIEMYFKSKKRRAPLHTTNPLALTINGFAETEQYMYIYDIIRKESSV